MLTRRFITGSQNFIAIIALSVLAAGCQPAASSFNGTTANNTNAANAANSAQTNEKMITIKQGTVGTIGGFSVGVKNVSTAGEGGKASADFAVWNSKLTPEKRNDYNIKFSAQSGALIPIGNKFYKVGKITSGADSTVEISQEPVGGAANLSESALAVPVGGNLELHGAVVEAVSLSADGKQASVEVYSNDYPKEESAKKTDGIVKSTVAAGDALDIGGIKHKIVAVHAAQNGAPGTLEIAIAPVK